MLSVILVILTFFVLVHLIIVPVVHISDCFAPEYLCMQMQTFYLYFRRFPDTFPQQFVALRRPCTLPGHN